MASKDSTQRAQSADAVAGRRDRPWLLPYNRRIRNVISISLRNLSLHASPSSRRRGQTIDDDAVPNTLVSPAKLVALREKKTLGHSRSSSDLRRVPEDGAYSDVESVKRDTGSPKRNRESSHAQEVGNGTPRTPPRPSFAKLRRRSTLEWANASPQSRQERLEGLTADRMGDAFFSLHTESVQDPIYVSEVVEHTMNPTFRSIDLDLAAPGTTRLDELIMRVWVKSTKWGSWRQLLELYLNLRELQYLCKHLEDLDRPLPHNAVVFHLPDGVYTTFNSLAEYVPPPMAPLARANSTRRLHTSSFDALLRLSKLDDSIQDALATRKQLAAELEAILEENRTAMTERDRVAEAQDRLKTIEYAKRTVSKQLEKARMQQEEKRKILAGRRDLMATDTNSNKLQGDDMRESRTEIPGHRYTLEQGKKNVQSQRRRICEDLQKVYPIQPIKNKALAFTIRDLPLPNSEEIDGSPPETIAAALGHVAQILQLLSFYLGTPLPYPVNPRSSTSTVYDPISLLPSEARKATTADGEKTLRTYPLFSRGVPRFRFEYALFLLNKDIQLMLDTGFGVRVLDIRHTLPNLKYLLYVATAGDGELPARKAGGIRGLMRGAGSESRAASSDSTSSALSGILWHGVRQDDGKGRGAVDSLRRNAGALDKRGKVV